MTSIHTRRWLELGKWNTPTRPNKESSALGQKTAASTDRLLGIEESVTNCPAKFRLSEALKAANLTGVGPRLFTATEPDVNVSRIASTTSLNRYDFSHIRISSSRKQIDPKLLSRRTLSIIL